RVGVQRPDDVRVDRRDRGRSHRPAGLGRRGERERERVDDRTDDRTGRDDPAESGTEVGLLSHGGDRVRDEHQVVGGQCRLGHGRSSGQVASGPNRLRFQRASSNRATPEYGVVSAGNSTNPSVGRRWSKGRKSSYTRYSCNRVFPFTFGSGFGSTRIGSWRSDSSSSGRTRLASTEGGVG